MKLNEIPAILTAPAGSARYGYGGETSDSDVFMLTEKDHRSVSDLETETDYFIISLDLLRSCWGHPLLLGNITGDCTGDERLCNFLRQYRWEITYSAPGRTGVFGLGYVAWGEAFGFDSPIKAGLRTALILSHMAAQAEDPFLLSEEEKAILLRARTGDVPPEERVDIYRRTISPENINRLRKMPDHPTIKNELFQLIEEITAQQKAATSSGGSRV